MAEKKATAANVKPAPTKPRALVLRLVPAAPKPAAVSRETVAALEQMLEGARAGEIVGLAVVAQMADGNFFADALGGCRADPVTSRGMLRSLDDRLAELIEFA